MRYLALVCVLSFAGCGAFEDLRVAAENLKDARIAMEAGDKAEADALLARATATVKEATEEITAGAEEIVKIVNRTAQGILEDPSIPNTITQIMAALGAIGVVGIGGNAVRKKLKNGPPTQGGGTPQS